jgi:DNA-binding NtrC family response regulator
MKKNKATRWMVVENDKDTLETILYLLGAVTQAEIRPFRFAFDALDAFTVAPETYELVITNFEMAEMNGVDLRRHMQSLAPSLKVLLITSGGLFCEESALRNGFCGLLQKPFSLNTFKQAVEAARSRPVKRTALSAAI